MEEFYRHKPEFHVKVEKKVILYSAFAFLRFCNEDFDKKANKVEKYGIKLNSTYNHKL